jgi:predicted Zn-dependent protease
MINFAISLGVFFAVSVLLKTLDVSLWFGAPIGLIAGGAAFVFINKRVQEKLEAIFGQAMEQFKRQQVEQGIKTMQTGYSLAPWQFLLKGSIHGQIGAVLYVRDKHAEAEPLLRAAGMNQYIAKAMLAVLQWKRGEAKLAKETLALATKAGRKESLMYAVHAYVLNEMRDREGAIELLDKGLKNCKNDERLLANRTLLQSKKPMKMKVYGEQWYQFMIERQVVRMEPPPYARISKKHIK